MVVEGAATPSDSVEGWDAVVSASDSGRSFRCTLLAVGELYDAGKVGGYFHVGKMGKDNVESAAPARIPAKKAYQLLAHSLSLDSTAGEALVAYEYPADVVEAIASPYAEGSFAQRDDDDGVIPDDYHDVKMESRLIQGMRAMGFTLVMELDVLVGKGVAVSKQKLVGATRTKMFSRISSGISHTQSCLFFVLQAWKEYIENPPAVAGSTDSYIAKKTAQDEEDERIMAILDANIAEEKAIKEKKLAAQKKVEVEGIAKEWAIKEYSLRSIAGDIDESVSEKDFMISHWDEALAEGDKTWEYINSASYKAEMKKKERSDAINENKLFWEDMPPRLRKEREAIVERVKKQYMDLLSEEELEAIVLGSD